MFDPQSKTIKAQSSSRNIRLPSLVEAIWRWTATIQTFPLPFKERDATAYPSIHPPCSGGIEMQWRMSVWRTRGRVCHLGHHRQSLTSLLECRRGLSWETPRFMHLRLHYVWRLERNPRHNTDHWDCHGYILCHYIRHNPTYPYCTDSHSYTNSMMSYCVSYTNLNWFENPKKF